MWRVIILVVLGLMVQSISAANLNAAQAQAVKAYLAKANKEAAANRESVEEISTVSADLNGDGRAEIILHALWAGGTWYSSRVIVFTDTGKGYQAVAETSDALGNVESIEVRNALVHVHALWPGPNDPRCCPTQKKTAIYQWQGNKLIDASRKNATHNIPVPSEPMVTSNSEWKFAMLRGLKLAGISNGIKGIAALNVYCEGKTPALAVIFSASQPDPVRLEIQIGHVIYPFIMAQQSNAAGYRIVNISQSAFPKGLISGQQQAQVKINGVNHGVLSLRNAGTTSRAALSACYRY